MRACYPARSMASGQDVLADFERASRREWLLTDGLGGLACGTASGAPTRRAHALFAAASPGGALTTLVLRCEEKLALGGAMHELSSSFVNGRARAGAFAQLEAWECEPWPRWRWRFGDAVIERAFRPIDGHAALLATWRLVAGGPARLSVAPLLTARAPWALLREQPEFRGAAQGIPGRVRLETLAERPALTLWHNGLFVPGRGWAHGLTYPLDFASEDDGTAPECGEDAFLPGWVQAALAQPGDALHLVFSTEEGLFRALATEGMLGTPPARTLNGCVAALDGVRRDRRAHWRRAAFAGADLTARQAAAAHGGGSPLARRPEPLLEPDDPVVGAAVTRLGETLTRRGGRLTFAPRLPGEAERGADTLRAAAALVTLRAFEPARQIALGALEFLDEGLVPERFEPGDGAPRYGDPSASLWLVHLVDLIARRGSAAPGSDAFLRDAAWPALEGVLQHLRAGSRHGVRCDADGLLWSGEGGAASAHAGVNALWYHALVAMAQLGKLLGRRENAAFYLAWAHELHRRYVDAFWDERTGALFECVTPGGRRRGLSPAQLLAVALPPALLPAANAQRLLATVERELLTAHGLRAAPEEAAADPSWLGVWAAAALRARGRDAAVRAVLERRLAVAAEAAPLSALTAAELLRGWLEECDRAEAAAAR